MVWELGIQTDTDSPETLLGTCLLHPTPPQVPARGEPGRNHGSPCFGDLQKTLPQFRKREDPKRS